MPASPFGHSSQPGLQRYFSAPAKNLLRLAVSRKCHFHLVAWLQVLNAALSGFGLAYVPEDLAQPHLRSGRLTPVLKVWWRKFPGYHLYYSHRHETTRAMQVLIDALRYK